MIRLVNYSKVPPGEYWYRDSHRAKPFGPSPEIHSVARELSKFRAGNHFERPSVNECLEDIELFTCQRLPPKNEWCYNTEQDYQQSLSQIAGQSAGGGCGTCGARVS